MEKQNEFIKFWIEDGILFSEYLEPTTITKDIAIRTIDLRHEISNHEKQYWCYNFTNVISMPKDGRDYADKYGQDYLHASAAIVKSHVQAFIVNIFIKLKNPKVPFKAFTTKQDALNWLRFIKTRNELMRGHKIKLVKS